MLCLFLCSSGQNAKNVDEERVWLSGVSAKLKAIRVVCLVFSGVQWEFSLMNSGI